MPKPMWRMKPRARIGTMMSMNGVLMKSQPTWNQPSPVEKRTASSATLPKFPCRESITEKKLMVPCRSRKITRKAPETLWTNFLPMEEVKNLAIIRWLFR